MMESQKVIICVRQLPDEFIPTSRMDVSLRIDSYLNYYLTQNMLMKLTLLYNLYIFHTIYFVENFYNFYMLSKKSSNEIIGLIYNYREICF